MKPETNDDSTTMRRAHDRLPGELVSTVTTPAPGATECTIYPPDAGDAELVTRWITAREGAFVALESMR